MPPQGWPLLLSGPIVRRVERRTVSIFVALSEQRTVKVDVYGGNSTLNPSLASKSEPTVQVGDNLHLAVITAVPANDLLEGIVYGYDVTFSGGGGTQTLSSLGLLNDPYILGYTAGRLPTFALPPVDIAKLRIIHASCRLPHALGLDAFPALDQIVGTAVADPLVRPHMLLLTGDQIYADDVDPSLLAHASSIGEQALGWAEQIPGVDAASSVTAGDFRLAPARRSPVMAAAGFSSSAQSSHLITLAEFVGMYLLIWSDALWLSEADGFLPPKNLVFGHPDWQKPDHKSERERAERRAGRGRSHVIQMAKGVLQVRRALANVPTYMAFDDHEVSDDWYIDKAWKDQVEASELGKRVLANALTAFALFQAWGNDSAQFEQNQPGRVLLDQLPAWRGDESQLAQRTAIETIRGLLKVPSPIAPANRLVWDYELICPSFKLIVLDSRTERGFPATGGPQTAPALIRPPELTRQLANRLVANPKSLTIILAPAPVLGVHWIEEEIQMDEVRDEGRSAVLGRDYEAWAFNQECFQEVLRLLAGADNVLLVSGDVHFGFAATADYWDERGGVTRAARIVQLTSSGLKNEGWKTRGLSGAPVGEVLADPDRPRFLNIPIPVIGLVLNWIVANILAWTVSGKKANSSWLGWTSSGAHLKKGTTLVNVPPASPNVGPAAPALQQVRTTRADSFVNNPEWRYRVSFVSDERSAGQRTPPQAPPAPPVPQTPAASYLETVHALARRHRHDHHWSQMRQLVGYNNIGDLTFTWTAASKSVRQSLWFAIDPKVSSAQGPYTTYDVPFAVPDPNDKPRLDHD